MHACMPAQAGMKAHASLYKWKYMWKPYIKNAFMYVLQPNQTKQAHKKENPPIGQKGNIYIIDFKRLTTDPKHREKEQQWDLYSCVHVKAKRLPKEAHEVYWNEVVLVSYLIGYLACTWTTKEQNIDCRWRLPRRPNKYPKNAGAGGGGGGGGKRADDHSIGRCNTVISAPVFP